MKLSIAQVVLSILIILTACYVTGWMIHEALSAYQQPISEPAGGITYVDVTPQNDGLFRAARCGSYALPVLGILVLTISVIQTVKAEARTLRLFITNIVAGALIAALAIIITMWGYPTQFHGALGGGSNVIIFTNPGRSYIGVQSASGIMVALGLAVLGCGIVQLLKSRKV
jgi:hypothetical protein